MTISALAPANLTHLKDLSVLITGGASGLGLSSATLFAKSEAYVTIADVQDCSEIVDDLVKQGFKVQFVHCDVTNWDSLVNAFLKTLNFSPTKSLNMVAAFAGVDNTGHLVEHVAGAGVSLDDPPPPIPTLDPIEVNLKGTLYTATLALHYLRLKPQGATSEKVQECKSLAIVSSLAGYIDDTHNTAYTASKFGSRGLFRAIRAQAYQRFNIRVNAICPWAMRTPMTEPLLAKVAEFGIVPSKGITLVEHDVLTQALMRITLDESIYGLFGSANCYEDEARSLTIC